MTTGYSRPNSARTVASAASMAALFSGLLKSVSGSFLNSLSIIPPGVLVAPQQRAGMYSKTLAIAIATLLLLSGACSSALPWADEPIGEEVNLAFVVRNNLLFLPSATIDGKSGHFMIATSAARTAIDTRFAATLPRAPRSGEHTLQLNEKESLRFTPVALDLRNVADAMIGADVWGNRAVSIDYQSGLLTYQKEGIHPELM